ncbi:hypothetical protein BDQ17DRAFT_1259627, partial [Cyathus striatus]
LCSLCLHPTSQCWHFLGKGRGANGKIRIDQKISSGCLMKMNFSYNVASESTASSPCSNVPMNCPICPSSKPAIWKYFMKHHFEDRHGSQTLMKYSHLWYITPFEHDEMRRIWKKGTSGVVKTAKSSANSTLKVSEAHCAQINPRYLYLLIFCHCVTNTYCPY